MRNQEYNYSWLKIHCLKCLKFLHLLICRFGSDVANPSFVVWLNNMLSQTFTLILQHPACMKSMTTFNLCLNTSCLLTDKFFLTIAVNYCFNAPGIVYTSTHINSPFWLLFYFMGTFELILLSLTNLITGFSVFLCLFFSVTVDVFAGWILT